jgi:L-ascorbate metabolism protein UlaG (beta-lactamase superfamily)
MRLTKHTHATVTLDKGAGVLLIDPGAFTPNAAELLSQADTVLITHEHFDHFDGDAIVAEMQRRPELQLYGPAAVTRTLTDVADRAHAVSSGDTFTTAGFDVVAFVADHAVIHPEIPMVDNAGFLIDGHVFHPGDAYLNPHSAVEVLLLPISGPWISTEQAIDYVRTLAPKRTIAIHDLMLSDTGKTSSEMFLGENSLTKTPMEIMGVGEVTTLIVSG